jgi:hypothetical protein
VKDKQVESLIDTLCKKMKNSTRLKE